MSPKAERDWRLYADDIIEACGKVRRFVAGMTYDTFAADERTRDAVIRNLEIMARPRGTCRTRSPRGRHRSRGA
jgi:uncharacterized protein with HEPN domain